MPSLRPAWLPSSVAILLLGSSPLPFAASACARPEPAPPASTVDQLFDDLDDDSADARDRAETELIRRGRPVLEELDRLARWADPERRARVKAIRAAIERGEQWGRVQGLLERVRDPRDRARVLADLQADLPERVERGMAALVGWIAWDRFDAPPAVDAPHDLTPDETAAALEPALSRIPLEPDWNRLKRMAIAWAGTAGRRDLAAVLRRFLADSDPSIRADALEAMTTLAVPGAAERAAELLEDPAPQVRVAAVEYILSHGSDGHLDAVLGLLAIDVSTRAPAARIVIQRSARFAPLLASRLGHADARVRWGALHLLSAAGLLRARAVEAVPLLADPDEAVRSLCEQALVEAGAVEAVRAGLAHAAPLARFHAARAAGCLCRRELGDALEPLLADARPFVRGAAVESIGRLRATRHAAAVARLLDSPQRAQAVEALGLLEADEHADEVARALADPAHRTAAAVALARMGDARGVDALRELFDDPSSGVWSVNRALLALNRLRAPEAWRKLSGADAAHPPGLAKAVDALEAVCRAAGLALEIPEGLSVRLRTVAYEFRSPHRSADLLWEMSFSEWAYVLEEGGPRLRVAPRAEAVEFWKRWLAER